MAALREIKNRIEATRKTSQITKAMNMVSASKLRKTERKYRSFQPIKQKVKSILEDVLASNLELRHPLLAPRDIKKTGYILVTSDRGLAGPYNNNIIKHFEQVVKERHTSKTEYIVGTIGYKGFTHCRRKRHELINSESIGSRDEFHFIDFQAMSRAFIDLYLQGGLDKIIIIYSHFVNTLIQEVREEVFLPVTDLTRSTGERCFEFLFEPDPESVMDELLPIYLENTLYGIILDAKTSEHASRMTAMRNATDNASEVIRKQTLTFNRARQAEITKELTDIIGGANAVT
ncbi:MAG: ATP synthase F1 subunit gamma [Bacilli bacterium]|nr:ATP synthase F1 subunit gamma [Bacilli bacterium]MBN2696672.1 ATP synthase F1 subunit gamma [Bacilli bacterium]